MRKLFIGILAVAVVFGMSMGVMAENQDATILQGQGEDEGLIEQTGSDNEALINQSTHTFSFGDTPYESTAANDFEDNLADIFQEGINNDALIWQMSDEDDGLIDQQGDNNIANIIQNSGNDKVNEAEIFQYGYGDESNISQYGHGGDNFAVTKQVGEEGSPSNIINVNQLGDGNDAYVTQGFNWQGFAIGDKSWDLSGSAVYGNDATINQFGDDNVAGIAQFGNENDATINQWSEDSDAAIIQNGNNDSATITQLGNIMGEGHIEPDNDNRARIEQSD